MASVAYSRTNVWPVCLMFRRLIRQIVSAVKTLKMSELTRVEAPANAAAAKRPIEETQDAANGIKKMKTLPDEEDTDKVPRFRKKKVAMFFLYNGAGYQGLQRNPNARTIESELLAAMVKAGVISQEGADDPGSKISFQRAARTDKGVSAAGQVISLKIFIDVEKPVEKINEHLPAQIRVVGIRRVTQGFNSKNHCVARTYLYVIPTLAFCPVEKVVREDFRVTDDIMAKVRSVLQQYKGTHNFHNFTSGKKPEEDSAKRYIMEFGIGEPFVREGLEFAVMTVKGQSFMIHQIRKMVGIAIAIVRGLASEESIQKAWAPEKFDVPIAPSMGLLLDKLHYDAYNRKYGNDGMHVPVAWDEHADEVEQFKEEKIFSAIYRSEKNDKSMLNWMSTLHLHTFDISKPSSQDGQRDPSDLYYAFKHVKQLREEKAKCETATMEDNSVNDTTDTETAAQPEEKPKVESQESENVVEDSESTLACETKES